MLSAATEEKRQQFKDYIHHELVHIDAVRAIIGIGSIASGDAHPDSDVDAIVFLEPFDVYAVPAEATWRKSDNSYHSIFSDVFGLQIDFLRLDLTQWRNPDFEWLEPRRAELAGGWLVYDRTGAVTRLIAERTAYDDKTRLMRLDDAVIWLDGHLGEDTPEIRWSRLEAVVAHDRLTAAYVNLVRALFAYNRCWLPWRNREMGQLLSLPWLPHNFSSRVIAALYPKSVDYDGYMTRVEVLRNLFSELMQQLKDDGIYHDDPIGEAFVRSHDEPGRAWNIREWELEHRKRYTQT